MVFIALIALFQVKTLILLLFHLVPLYLVTVVYYCTCLGCVLWCVLFYMPCCVCCLSINNLLIRSISSGIPERFAKACFGGVHTCMMWWVLTLLLRLVLLLLLLLLSPRQLLHLKTYIITHQNSRGGLL